MKCYHHYQWSGGKLRCVRCGHRKWLTHRTKRKIRQVSILAVLLVIGFFGYQQYGNTIVNYIQTQKPQQEVVNSIVNVTKNIEAKTLNTTTTAFLIHNMINEQRKANGLTPLSWNSKLAQAALNHSIDMANRDYFEHDDPEGHDFVYRYSQVGFNCQIPNGLNTYSEGGENIMFMQGYYGENTIATQTVTGWMNSAGHRANILTFYFQSEGIGVAESLDGKVYATEDFC